MSARVEAALRERIGRLEGGLLEIRRYAEQTKPAYFGGPHPGSLIQMVDRALAAEDAGLSPEAMDEVSAFKAVTANGARNTKAAISRHVRPAHTCGCCEASNTHIAVLQRELADLRGTSPFRGLAMTEQRTLTEDRELRKRLIDAMTDEQYERYVNGPFAGALRGSAEQTADDSASDLDWSRIWAYANTMSIVAFCRMLETKAAEHPDGPSSCPTCGELFGQPFEAMDCCDGAAISEAARKAKNAIRLAANYAVPYLSEQRQRGKMDRQEALDTIREVEEGVDWVDTLARLATAP